MSQDIEFLNLNSTSSYICYGIRKSSNLNSSKSCGEEFLSTCSSSFQVRPSPGRVRHPRGEPFERVLLRGLRRLLHALGTLQHVAVPVRHAGHAIVAALLPGRGGKKRKKISIPHKSHPGFLGHDPNIHVLIGSSIACPF